MTDKNTSPAPGSFSKLMSSPPSKSPKPLQNPSGQQSTRQQRNPTRSRPASNAVERANMQPVKQSMGQSADQSTNGPSSGSTAQQMGGPVVNRPVSFYIPISINQKIDEAVDYLQRKHHLKVDRSAVVSAMLADPTLWKSQALDQLADQCMGQLTNRLTSRLMGRPVD